MSKSGNIKSQFRILLILLLLFFTRFNSFSQNIEIQVEKKALNEVLLELNQEYNIQISFNHQLLSNCMITKNQSYSTIEEAIKDLVITCGLSYDFNNNVFIIYQSSGKEEDSIAPIQYTYTGRILDRLNQEPLPYSTLQSSSVNLISDVNGNFAFKSTLDKEKIKVSYLGYYELETTIGQGNDLMISLTPSVVGLQEVVIKSEAKVYNVQMGQKAGSIKLNHKVASFLPGNNNNTLFNLLRLQPGVLAAAEQSGDYSIWGSYRGQNILEFDGIPLFSANSLDNEIGIVNPLLVKDVEIFKGGFGVEKGDKIGGIVEITGKQGNFEEFKAYANINSETISGVLNIPISNKLAFQAAFRQSYFKVFDWENIMDHKEHWNELNYQPDYLYRDLNLKLAGKLSEKDRFYISFIGNNDESEIHLDDNLRPGVTLWENETAKQNIGANFHYDRNWKSIGISSVNIYTSKLKNQTFSNVDFQNPHKDNKSYYRTNIVSEAAIKLNHKFPVKGFNEIQMGIDFIHNRTLFAEDTLRFSYDGIDRNINHVNFYLKDKISIGKIFNIQPGLKINFFPLANRYMLQPRINSELFINDYLKLNFAWGKYNQYLSEIPFIDDFQNQFYFWQLSDGKLFPMIQGYHNVGGLTFNKNNFKFSVEGFYKYYKGISNFRYNRTDKELTIVNGNGRSYGLDMFIKKSFKKHEFWLAYTLSKTEEDFTRIEDKYKLAPHDQRHELKLASILNFKPWYISVNYVYGSGLAFTERFEEDIIDYNRLDAALLYKFKTKKFELESGFSIVNILNSKNVAYQSITRLPGGKVIYPRGIPFTPSIFVNIGF